jgi:hypothetical protein
MLLQSAFVPYATLCCMMRLCVDMLGTIRIRDKANRRPDDPDYNPRTLRIPGDFFKVNKVQLCQQQQCFLGPGASRLVQLDPPACQASACDPD